LILYKRTDNFNVMHRSTSLKDASEFLSAKFYIRSNKTSFFVGSFYAAE
jgi:hypothetical protein